MKASVLIPDAGTGPANSLVRSLRAGGLDLRLVGYHSDPFTLKKSAADRNYLVPRYDSARFLDTLQHVIDTESVDLVIPNSDDEVEYFSETGRGLAVCGFLPRPRPCGSASTSTGSTSSSRRTGSRFPRRTPCPAGTDWKRRGGDSAASRPCGAASARARRPRAPRPSSRSSTRAAGCGSGKRSGVSRRPCSRCRNTCPAATSPASVCGSTAGSSSSRRSSACRTSVLPIEPAACRASPRWRRPWTTRGSWTCARAPSSPSIPRRRAHSAWT